MHTVCVYSFSLLTPASCVSYAFFFFASFCKFPDYDPALVPPIYTGEDLERARHRESVERQRELAEWQRKQQEEADRYAAAEAAAAAAGSVTTTTQASNIDLRIDADDINEIDHERKTVRPDSRQKFEYLTTSTTVRPTKRLPNKKDPNCTLPIVPDYGQFDVGYRFGTKNDSHIEYYDVPGRSKKSYEVTLEFKTNQTDGVLFHLADDNHSNFIALYMQDGYVSIQHPHHLARVHSKIIPYCSHVVLICYFVVPRIRCTIHSIVALVRPS